MTLLDHGIFGGVPVSRVSRRADKRPLYEDARQRSGTPFRGEQWQPAEQDPYPAASYADRTYGLGVQPPDNVRVARKRHRSEEMEWLRRNSEQYKGLWVALDGNRLVAASEDAEQVYRAAKCEGSGVPFVVHIHPESDLPFMGGW